MSNATATDNAFDRLTAACAAAAEDLTDANLTAVLVADDAARAEMGLEVML